MLNLPRVLIAGDRSSAGKTTISIGIMLALKDMGYKVQPFKVGLDFIDPSYHTEVTGRRSRNLDGYLMPESAVKEVFAHASKGADIAIIEGVRGLFEGLNAKSDVGSTAQIAKILKVPVILVINARSITRSAAAIVKGYKLFDPEVSIRGVILNNIGSERHGEKARSAIQTYTGIPVIGEVYRNNSMRISMRHLGLIPAIEGRHRLEDFDDSLKEIKHVIKTQVDIHKLVSLAKNAEPLVVPEEKIFKPCSSKHNPRIGVAMDEAFNFYYWDNLELLELNGAKLVYFSPIKDSEIPDVDGLYIGGGYPELYAKELEDNSSMRESIKQASSKGLPIYAECGGLMYLTQEIRIDEIKGNYMAEMNKCCFEMVGAIPAKTLMGHTRVVSYNIGSFIRDNVIGKAGFSFIAHEFHHSEIVSLAKNTSFAIKLERGTGIKGKYDGILVKNTLASYAHLHAVSYSEFAASFVDSCS